MVRIQQIRSLARDMLPGEDATGAVADAARQLILQSDAALRDAKQRQGNVLDKWTADTEHRIEELKETGFRELMDFDGDGRLRTVFNQEMIRVLKQARQISALGLEVPKRVSQGLQRVRDVTRRGMALMQVGPEVALLTYPQGCLATH